MQSNDEKLCYTVVETGNYENGDFGIAAVRFEDFKEEGIGCLFVGEVQRIFLGKGKNPAEAAKNAIEYLNGVLDKVKPMLGYKEVNE